MKDDECGYSSSTKQIPKLFELLFFMLQIKKKKPPPHNDSVSPHSVLAPSLFPFFLTMKTEVPFRFELLFPPPPKKKNFFLRGLIKPHFEPNLRFKKIHFFLSQKGGPWGTYSLASFFQPLSWEIELV